MSQPTLELTPQSLTQRLINSNGNLELLMEDLHCSAQELAKILYSDDFVSLQKLRINVAISRAKLQAAEFLPNCTAKLLQLTDAEKPEVARRAVMAVMGMAGVPTKSPPPPPPPPPPPTPEKTEEELMAEISDDQARAARRQAAFNNEMDYHCLDLSLVAHEHPGFVDRLVDFVRQTLRQAPDPDPSNINQTPVFPAPNPPDPTPPLVVQPSGCPHPPD